MATAKKASGKVISLTGQSVATVAGFALVRVQPKRRATPVPFKDSATVLVGKVGRALNKPGVDKRVVFRDNQTGVFSYSTYVNDPTKVVREAADGTKRIGNLINGKFVASKIVA